MRIKIPSYLQPGDTIGITCPAGYMAYEKAAECIRILENKWGYKVKAGHTLGSQSSTYFSGTDEERLADFQQMLDDDAVQAVLCGRGGYGMGRIIDSIDFTKFKKHPKWVIGFSDITVFHSHVNKNFNIATLHAPMAGAFSDKPLHKYVKSLHAALQGTKATYSCRKHRLNKTGEAKGALVGGNLALLVNSIGTPSDINTKGKILFIEDIGEYKYSIDRMLHQLKRSGKLNDLAGLLIGHFSDVKDTERPFGQSVDAIIQNIVKDYSYPIAYHFPVSHDKENVALKCGMLHTLQVSNEAVMLAEV